MKMLSICAGMFFLSGYLCFSQCYFHKLYRYQDGNFIDGGKSIVVLDNGGIIVTGLTSITLGNGGAYTIRVDDCGDTIWQRAYDYSPSGIEDGNRILKVTGNKFYVTGSKRDPVEGAVDGFIIAIDSNGTVLYENTIDIGHNDWYPSSILDNGNIIHGGYYNNTLPNAQAFIVKTDSLGNVIWHQDYGNTTTYRYPTNINKTFDGGYILSGRIDPAYNWFLMKTDSTGNVEWEKIYDKWGHTGYNIVTRDSGYLLVGHTKISNNEYRAYMLKADNNGDTIWTKQYSGSAIVTSRRIIRQLDDGSYIAAGEKRESANSGLDLWLIKLDEQGNMLWERQYSYYGGETHNYVEDLIITPEGDIAMTGYIIAVGNSNHTTGNDMHIIKVDSCGYLENDSIDAQFIYEQTNLYEITFTNQSQHYCTPLWYFGDGDSLYTQNPIHTYSDTGTYTVTLIVRAGNSLDTVTQQVVVSGTVGMSQQTADDRRQIRVYPNPASNELHIEVENAKHKIQNVAIHDVTGKQVSLASSNAGVRRACPEVVSGGQGDVVLDISHISLGLYFVQVELNNGTTERVRFIKQ